VDITLHTSHFDCAWNKFGTDKIAILADSTLRVWDPLNAGFDTLLSVPSATACAWSPCADQIMLAKDNSVSIKDSSLHVDVATYDNLFASDGTGE
jgi:hypothetical protein